MTCFLGINEYSIQICQGGYSLVYEGMDHLAAAHYYPVALRRLFLAMAEQKQVPLCSSGLTKKFGGLMRESTNPAVQPYNFSIEREKRMLACFSEREKNRPEVKYGGKEIDRTSGLDAYDFGARTYFADRLQWGQVDPMCEKYYDWSPYAYCKDNPIKYVDPDGNKIVDSKKRNAVYIKNDKIFFTKYATCDIKRIVNVLNLTKTGHDILISAIKSSVNISIIISPNKKIKDKSYTYGETRQGNLNKNDNYGIRINNGIYSITEASITIYEGTIVEDSNNSDAKHKGLTTDQAIAATTGHELVQHLIQMKLIKIFLQNEITKKEKTVRKNLIV